MKILCTISEAADIIRSCHDNTCYKCVLQSVCNPSCVDEKRPEKLMEIVEDVDADE